jgi:undecaprenyl-diphosphatase
MASILQAVLLGIVQGITEWLPVSSSGHLVLVQHYFGLSDEMGLDLMLHIGSLIVVLFVFRSLILDIVTGTVGASKLSIRHGSIEPFSKNHSAKLGAMVVLGTVPTVIIALLFRKTILAAFQSVTFVGLGLIFTGLLLWLTRFRHGNRHLGWKDALLIGTMQGVAVFPGISRSGSTISTGILRGADRDESAKFSFLLFIPAIIGATILEWRAVALTTPVFVGMVVSMVVGYLCLRLLMWVVNRGQLHNFSYYCLSIGLLAIIF